MDTNIVIKTKSNTMIIRGIIRLCLSLSMIIIAFSLWIMVSELFLLWVLMVIFGIISFTSSLIELINGNKLKILTIDETGIKYQKSQKYEFNQKWNDITLFKRRKIRLVSYYFFEVDGKASGIGVTSLEIGKKNMDLIHPIILFHLRRNRIGVKDY